MDDDINHLVLTPFQEIVEKGKLALENATNAGLSKSDAMPKAAQSLVREGERALKKIEPLCKKHWEEYSANFVVALKEDEEITRFRTELNELLWDFDSFVEVEDFDAGEFANLQSLSRKAAPRIYDILLRMKLEHPPSPFIGFDSAGVSRSTSAAGRSVVSDTQVPSTETPQTIEEESQDTELQEPPVSSDVKAPMGAKAGPDLGYEVKHPQPVYVHWTPSQRDNEEREQQRPDSPVLPRLRTADSVRPDEIPQEPPVDPWEPVLSPGVPADVLYNGESSPQAERRNRSTSDGMSQFGTQPAALLNAFGEPNGAQPRPRRLDEGVTALMLEARKREAALAEGNAEDSSAEHVGNGNQNPAPRNASVSSSQTTGVPPRPLPSTLTTGERRKMEDRSRRIAERSAAQVAGAARPENRMLVTDRYSQASSTNSHASRQSSVFDPGARDSMVSPITDPRLSVHEDFNPSPVRTREPYHVVHQDSNTSPIQTIHEEQPVARPGWASSTRTPPAYRPRQPPQPGQVDIDPLPREQPGLIVAQNVEEQPGLEPVLNNNGSAPGASNGGPSSVALREPNCAITVDSSFYQLKGFCDGGKDIIRGGIGVRKVKKEGIAGANLVAKCMNKACMFELEWKEVEMDVNYSEAANYSHSGIGFRLRFISKSHLVARNINDHMYGCLFCVQMGKTPEESDATVFPDQKALFSHLARHPRPLPAVPGLTVVESAEIPQHLRNNYDLHFPSPPIRSLMTGLARELSRMPVAIATDSFRRTQISSFRVPPDPSTTALQFFAGQRIVGVEFPAKFGGEWALGWADNVRGAFPAECIRLEAPPPGEVRKNASSNLRAVARWKRNPKDKDLGGWLKFEKGEVISNISFAYVEHWCWYGSNSKGKFGIFPQSHMEPNTLCEAPAGDTASVVSHETKSPVAGMRAKFSLRRREPRPASSAGSHSSGDTATQLSPRQPVY